MNNPMPILGYNSKKKKQKKKKSKIDVFPTPIHNEIIAMTWVGDRSGVSAEWVM